MVKYHQGIFKPKNKEKYKGDSKNIIYRSSWELSVMMKMDEDKSVLKWSSEEIIIPYISKADNKLHRYFMDFWALRKMADGSLKEFIIEIKPEAQTKEPKRPKKINKRYIEEVKTYATNISKWEAAQKYAEKNNMIFEILTEKQLGVIL